MQLLLIVLFALFPYILGQTTQNFDGDINLFSIQNRIAGGISARPGQFPFQVGVARYRRVPGVGVYSSWCGGVLISDELVLTAAHCAVELTSVEIYLGTTDMSRTEPHQIKLTSPEANVFVHENYTKPYLDNDIALIKLPRKVPLNEYIQPVNLPRLSQISSTFEKTVGWISGWGKVSDDIEKASNSILQFARRWILPPEYCETQYRAYFLKDIHACVDGSQGISACGGDSGGPLTVIEEDGSRTLVGVTSYGKREGCEKGYPVVYTKVMPYLHWIAEKGGIKIRE